MTTSAQCVYILMGLITLNVGAFKHNKRQETDSNGTDFVVFVPDPMQEVIVTPTTEPTTELTISLKYWDMDVHCKFQPNGFPCVANTRSAKRWYYDTKMGDCKVFEYYKCKSDIENDFKTHGECYSQCRDEGPRPVAGNLPTNAACLMQPDVGECKDYIPMFYYDITTRRCAGFAFSGCGGNQNRFLSAKLCQAVCGPATHFIIGNSKFARDDGYE